MAKSWSGFVAQNQEVKEQWGLLEESRSKIDARLRQLSQETPEEGSEPDEEPSFIEMG